MGTNYYLERKTHGDCPTCGKPGYENEQRIHVGKSSGGWCFALHVYPFTDLPQNLTQWTKLWQRKDVKIVDEYGRELSPLEMLEIITKRSWAERKEPPHHYASWHDFYAQNHAEPGPNNLMRHRLDKDHCIEHGEGTWDLVIGEFS